jgi:pimeloyl-ACP methyl ester carboxylesterase
MREELMNRRNLLPTAAAVAGIGLFAGDPEGTRAASRERTAASSPRGVTPFFETRDGAILYCKEWPARTGSGGEKTFVFVHSWSANTELWQYQMLALSDRGFRCFAYDQRGHGRASDPGRGYDYDTLADDLAEVMEKYDLRDAVMVGHSMSGGTITRYVTRHGAGRVRKLVMIAPTLPFILKTADNPDGVDEKALAQQRDEWTRDFPEWLGANARMFFVPGTPQEMVDWVKTMAMRASLRALVDLNHALTETDFRAELKKFPVPTLVIHGTADVSALLDFTGRMTAALIPGAQLKVYEGAPHGLMFTHTDRLNADLIDFGG